MAQTYYVADALALISKHINRTSEADNATYVANLATNLIWNKYDWRETIDALPPFYLIPGEQDHGSPQYAIPTNFLGLRQASLVNTFSEPVSREPLRVTKDLELTHVEGLPKVLGVEAAGQKLRVYPRVPRGLGATEWLIDGTYKVKPTKLTAATLQTSLVPWDDLYINVFVAALRWAAFDLFGDQRAGLAQKQNGMVVYTGALGAAHDLIDQMANEEGFNLGDPIIAPAEALVGGLYGWDARH